MLARLQEFFALLRKNGVPVSAAESLDALRAVELVGIEDPHTFGAALGAALIKRPVHQEIFDELFPLFFLRRGEIGFQDRDQPLVAGLAEAGFSEDEIESLLAVLASQAAEMGATARMGLGLRQGPVESLLRLSGVQIDFSRLQNPLQIGFYTQQLVTQLRFREAEAEVQGLVRQLESKLGAERAAQLAAVLLRQLGALRQTLRRYVSEEFERQNARFRERFRQETLADKPFTAMTEEELTRLTEEVARLGRKLKQMVVLRPRLGRRGRLDARRTVRRSMRSGGVPFDLCFKRRRIDKPRLVVLCDISDSVRQVSRFMLQFAYTLQDQFSQVRSFVFVSDIAEVTQLFRDHELRTAVEMAYRGAAVNVFANSNYGRAFVQFHARHLETVTPKTTVILIGDGRNNYNPDEAWALAEVKARAKRVLWLNPEPPTSWSFGDSVMLRYEPHCDRVEVVHNLASLKKVVDGLVL
ncbi:MAG TPA: VWA domain-containing protein [Polyangia bacterium]|nr:VWA domain-containing protein [Polyangia bacterium]